MKRKLLLALFSVLLLFGCTDSSVFKTSQLTSFEIKETKGKATNTIVLETRDGRIFSAETTDIDGAGKIKFRNGQGSVVRNTYFAMNKEGYQHQYEVTLKLKFDVDPKDKAK